MNIFMSSPCPRECAVALDDKRLVKMVLETAQLTSGACRLWGFPTQYSITHINHPCAVFTRRNRLNFIWVLEHGLELAREYSNRFGGKIHASEAVLIDCAKYVKDVPLANQGVNVGFNCSGYDTGDLFEDYKQCLRDKWKLDRSPKWTGRRSPIWRFD